jgi:hypothetical protein
MFSAHFRFFPLKRDKLKAERKTRVDGLKGENMTTAAKDIEIGSRETNKGDTESDTNVGPGLVMET